MEIGPMQSKVAKSSKLLKGVACNEAQNAGRHICEADLNKKLTVVQFV